MKKKILLLGGAFAQIPFIEEAKRKNLYVVTCDYLPDNPGHKLADEYYNISTTDKQGVLELARKLDVDYVYAYASDPGIPVATYVAEKLGIGTNSFEVVQCFSEKDLFRRFLKKNGFNYPKNVVLKEGDDYKTILNELSYPFIIKPTDSSGSKGVIKIEKAAEIENGVAYSLSFSRNRRLIAEEFIESEGHQFHGDGFVSEGKLVFSYLGDHHYNDEINPFVPYSTSWPTKRSKGDLQKVITEVEKIIDVSDYKAGPINIEARIDQNGKVYIMEIGMRSGGNFVPQIIKHATGFDMVQATLFSIIGEPITFPDNIYDGVCAYYVLHSKEDGLLRGIEIDEKLKKHILEFYQYKNIGDRVNSFNGANAAVGLLLLHFDSLEDREEFYNCANKYIVVKVGQNDA